MTKTFKAPRNNRPPLDFEIQYEKLVVNAEDGTSAWEEQTEKFQARPMVAGHLLMKIASAMDAGVAIQSAEMVSLLHSAIMPEFTGKFMELIDDDDVAVPIDTLGEILAWLAEEYTGRPTTLV